MNLNAGCRLGEFQKIVVSTFENSLKQIDHLVYHGTIEEGSVNNESFVNCLAPHFF